MIRIVGGNLGWWVVGQLDPKSRRLVHYDVLDHQQFIDLQNNKNTPEPSEKKSGCSGGGIVSWLGIRWIGVPYPKRLFWRGWIGEKHQWPIGVKEMKGCGCIVKLKILWLAVKWVWNA